MDLSRYIGMPLLATEHGKSVDNLLAYVHWLMIILFIGWSAYFLYAVFRFSAKRNPKADYVGVKSHIGTYLEVGVALVEAVLLFGFSIPLWAKVVDRPPEGQGTVVIRMVAHQFNWTFLYPGKDGKFGRQDVSLVKTDNPLGLDKTDPLAKDDFIVEGDFQLPVNKDVIIHLSSQDVIHSFKIVPFRITQDCIPGMSIPTWFKPTVKGRYQINCSQLCGNGHYSMRGTLSVVEQAEFDAWIAKKSGGAAAGGGGGSYE